MPKPANPTGYRPSSKGELSDHQLDAVSGGGKRDDMGSITKGNQTQNIKKGSGGKLSNSEIKQSFANASSEDQTSKLLGSKVKAR